MDLFVCAYEILAEQITDEIPFDKFNILAGKVADCMDAFDSSRAVRTKRMVDILVALTITGTILCLCCALGCIFQWFSCMRCIYACCMCSVHVQFVGKRISHRQLSEWMSGCEHVLWANVCVPTLMRAIILNLNSGWMRNALSASVPMHTQHGSTHTLRCVDWFSNAPFRPYSVFREIFSASARTWTNTRSHTSAFRYETKRNDHELFVFLNAQTMSNAQHQTSQVQI